MVYTLTQEDIDKLVEKGFNMNGVAAGTEAMAGEMEVLMPDIVAKNIGSKISSDAGAPSVSPAQAQYGATKALNRAAEAGLEEITMEPRVEPPASAPMAPMDEAPAAAPSAAPAAAASPMMGLISADMYGAPISADPFENLSKNQRMMLAFAAIQDAGAALQGGEGNAFNKTLEGFAARQDMERKRQAQVAQMKAQERVLQGLGAGSLPPNPTPADIDAYISSLTNMLVTQPSLANFVTQKISQLTPLRDKLIADEQAAAESTERSNLLTPMVDRALSYINPEGATDEQGNPILNPDIANKLSRGYAAFSENIDYQDFMGNISTIKSQFTFKNMIDLKRKGVTFGALSTEELRQVADLIGTLDPANPLGSMRTLKRVRTMLNKDEGGGTGGLRFDPETGKLVEE